MNRSQMIKMMQQVEGQMFITRKGLATAIGVKDPHNVAEYLHGLPRLNNKYYYIPDVVDALLARVSG